MVEIKTPFDEADLPLVFQWLQGYWDSVADDTTPKSVTEWVESERSQSNVITFGVYRDGELGGYLKYVPALENLGFAHGFFKKSFWGRDTTAYAINLALHQLFICGVKVVLFVPFAHNHRNIAMLKSIGAVEVGPLCKVFEQNGVEVDASVLALTIDGWSKANADFVIERDKERQCQ